MDSSKQQKDSTGTACLVIIFNHKYDQNIERLEKLYADKFKHIFFLVPFYTGTKENVIPVYESSFYFQGYIAQGFKHFYKPEFTHYFFIGDDLILNPALDEKSYASLLDIDDQTSFIPEIRQFDTDHRWLNKKLGISIYQNRRGSEGMKEMPPVEEALQSLARHNIHTKDITYNHIFGKPEYWKYPVQTAINFYLYYWQWRKLKTTNHSQLRLSYPVVYGYSDIAIVAAESIQRFVHFCGILAAQGLFIEIALPTALLLSANKVITHDDMPFKGAAMWSQEEIQSISNKYEHSLYKLVQDFPDDILYYHPIKLSKWNQ